MNGMPCIHKPVGRCCSLDRLEPGRPSIFNRNWCQTFRKKSMFQCLSASPHARLQIRRR